jgi:spore germination cell wall hydrolase CwlJ-like protein
MTALRTRLWAALACLAGLFPAAGAASVGQPSKAIAKHAALTASAKAPLTRPLAVAALNPNGPAQPFVLQASASDRALAEHCLAQAVYYEAGLQPVAGQEAVAQTVLNRLRHPDYPKSVCGVVYEGSSLRTGCQFSFTCDGSLRRGVDASLWLQSMTIAKQALNGFVMPAVGEATYYHADYVRPYWAGALRRITQIGAHIFYRWPGASGDASAFNGQYAGHEADLSTVLRATDPRLETVRPAVLRRTAARAPDLREAVARNNAGGYRMIEATYTTTAERRVHSVIPAAAPSPRPAVAAQTAAALPTPAVHPAKVTLPPVHPTEVVAQTVFATAPK